MGRAFNATALVASATAVLVGVDASATNTQYNNRPLFEAQLGTLITDDYSHVGYTTGDVIDNPTFDIHSNASMSAVLGETDYQSTGFQNWNIIGGQPANPNYCAGCNGSYLLIFTSTSVGSATGVYGAGFDFTSNSSDPNLQYHAFVTYGDNTTQDFLIPAGSGFWGLTSDIDVQNIHIGLANGGTTQSGSIVMDNLTIGSAVPAPGALALLGLAGFVSRRRRR